MNSKMTTNSQLSTNEPKKIKENNENKKLSNQLDQEQIREMDITWRDFIGEGKGRNKGEEVQGRRSIISRHKIERER